MSEKQYPITMEVLHRRRSLLSGYSAWSPKKGSKKNIGAGRRRHYVLFRDAALEMGYASEKSAEQALVRHRFELPVFVLEIPPAYYPTRYVKQSQLSKLLADPPTRMLKRLKKKGLAGTSG